MNLSMTVLGSHTVKRLQLNASEHVLQIGKDKLTRAELAAVGCYNFTAARNLTHVLGELGISSLKQVFDSFPPASLALPHMGVISLAVLGAAFEAKGIGGAAPLETYARKHTDAHLVTFDTIKHRDQKARAQERKDKKRRKAQRRDQAHQVRVERFEERTSSPA